MDKEEILKKSRQEKKDERELYINNKALVAGFWGFYLLTGLLIFINQHFNQNTSHLMALWEFATALNNLAEYRHKKEKIWLILGIGWIVFSGLNLWDYLQFLMG